MTARNRYLLVAVFSLLVPFALALILFPTPLVDPREVLAWGWHFVLINHKHPPMQFWMGGLVDVVFGPSAAAAILVGQILNAVAALYVYATIRLFAPRDRAMLFAFLFVTTVYFIGTPLSFAINAEVLQLPSWAAILFHVLRAWQTDRWRHWLLAGVWAAAAMWTKYTGSLLFFAIVAATLIVPEFRRVWRNPRLYAGIAVALVLFSPNLVALWLNRGALGYAEGLLRPQFGIGERLWLLVEMLFGGILFFLLPGWLIVAGGLRRGDLVAAAPPEGEERAMGRFLTAVLGVFLAGIVFLIVGVGFLYHRNYDAPFLLLIPLAAAAWVGLRPATRADAERRVATIAAATAGGIFALSVIVYGFFTGHGFLQEPLAEASTIVRADWSRLYSCGPAYILGDRSSSHGLAIYGDLKPYGLPVENLAVAPWYDPAALKRDGAIVIYRDELPMETLHQAFPGAAFTAARSMTLPLVDTFASLTVNYRYLFIPPQSCDSAGTG